MELKLLKRYSITIKYANLIFYLNFKAYSGVGKAAHCQLGVPCSVPAHATNFYTSTPVIEITTTIVDHISCMWSKVDNFSCYFSTNSRENFTTNLLVFRTREISKGVAPVGRRLSYRIFKIRYILRPEIGTGRSRSQNIAFLKSPYNATCLIENWRYKNTVNSASYQFRKIEETSDHPMLIIGSISSPWTRQWFRPKDLWFKIRR